MASTVHILQFFIALMKVIWVFGNILTQQPPSPTTTKPEQIAEILFNGDRFLKYTPSRLSDRQENINRIKLQFRTIHPTGALVFMLGSRGDSLSLELVQGRLRYVNKCDRRGNSFNIILKF